MRHTPGPWTLYAYREFYESCQLCFAYREVHVNENSDSKTPWKIVLVSATGLLAPVSSSGCIPDLAKVDNW